MLSKGQPGMSAAKRMISSSCAWSRCSDAGTFAVRQASLARLTRRPDAYFIAHGNSRICTGERFFSAARITATMVSRLYCLDAEID